METNNIRDNIKKYFYSGVGFAAHSSDIIKGVVDEFVTQGKLSETDGHKIVNGAIQKIEDRYNETAQKVGDYAASEISMLRKQIEALEKKLSSKSPTVSRAVKAVKKASSSRSPVKKAVKKAAPKKAAAKASAPKKAAAKKAVKPAAKKAVKKAASKR
jgi:polyhydroxyalkanoate synthesis regulator phasin